MPRVKTTTATPVGATIKTVTKPSGKVKKVYSAKTASGKKVRMVQKQKKGGSC